VLRVTVVEETSDDVARLTEELRRAGHDVSLEDAETAAQHAAVETLAAGLAHEINNPLSAALLNLEVMGELLAAPDGTLHHGELCQSLSEARDALGRLREVVRQLHATPLGGPLSCAEAPSCSRRGRVLVVDDEPLLAAAIHRVLAREHDVVTATRAEDALERLRAGAPFDVIFSDLMMPQITGMELYARICQEFPEQAPRVVFLTGGAFTDDARDFLAKVQNSKIAKPIDVRSLMALVNERVRSSSRPPP
jgi:CheY-like chemotaxis protein